MMNFQFCGKLNYWAACGTQLWNELSLSQKDKRVDCSPRRHSISHSPYNGADFWEEGMGHYFKVVQRTDLEVNLEQTQNYCRELLALYPCQMIN